MIQNMCEMHVLRLCRYANSTKSLNETLHSM
jgi:hypothetical protein